MNERTEIAIAIGIPLVVVLGLLLAYRIILYSVRQGQRGMSTRQRQRKQHWAIRIDDALRSRRLGKVRASEKRALQKRRRSR